MRRTVIQLPSIASSGSYVATPLAQFIDALGWVSGTMLVRVYNNSMSGAGGSALVNLYNVMVGSEDPSVTLQDSQPIATVTINQGTGANLYTARIPGQNAAGPYPIGRYVSVGLSFTAGANALSGSITLAVDLIGRDA